MRHHRERLEKETLDHFLKKLDTEHAEVCRNMKEDF